MKILCCLRMLWVAGAVQAWAWAAPACAQPIPATLADAGYGADPSQLADVYLPPHPANAPILVVVHGGAWRYGDKASPGVIEQKVAYWLPKGYIVVSLNYRMLPAAGPGQQALDLGRALAWVQGQSGAWHGDAARLFVMGHSSGGHMVALLAADRAMRERAGVKPWRASIILDGAGFDLLDVMPRPHAAFYDDAFGADRAGWIAASPAEHLGAGMAPTLLICSTLRAESCRRAEAYGKKLTALGNRAIVKGVARNHGEIDADVGDDNEETREIAGFMQAQSRP
jgi:arylformamidase